MSISRRRRQLTRRNLPFCVCTMLHTCAEFAQTAACISLMKISKHGLVVCSKIISIEFTFGQWKVKIKLFRMVDVLH